MDPGKAETGGISTLLLIQDEEYDLHASCGSVSFAQWGEIEARGKKRLVSISLSLAPRHPEKGLIESQANVAAAVPLVITAPTTARFQLHNTASCSSLLSLLHQGVPLQFLIEFVPPRDNDDDEGDAAWANFQDQITIQTRLARLCIHLWATKERGTAESADPAQAFMPRVLPSVKAPSFKVFDQIEKNNTAVAAVAAAAGTCRTSVSGTFHPHRNTENNRLESLVAGMRPPRTPPSAYDQEQSRSSNVRPLSGERRTSSPRILEPLPTMPPAPQAQSQSVSADVNTQREAREVILRLRARRSSVQGTTRETITQSEPDVPESRLDAKTKAGLDDFNSLVKSAKMTVAGEMDRAKHELDFYKSLLPMQPVLMENASLPAALLPQVAANRPTVGKKPARLPTLQPSTDEGVMSGPVESIKSSSDTSLSGQGSNNQHLSPVKLSRSKQTAERPLLAKTTGTKQKKQEPEEALDQPQPQKEQHRSSGPAVTATRSSIPLKTQPAVQPTRLSVGRPRALKETTTVAMEPPNGKKPSVAKNSKATVKAVTSKKTAKISSLSSAAATMSKDALLDFDDSDPEIDDAPAMPDDLRGRCSQEQQEDEDDMMRMLAR